MKIRTLIGVTFVSVVVASMAIDMASAATPGAGANPRTGPAQHKVPAVTVGTKPTGNGTGTGTKPASGLDANNVMMSGYSIKSDATAATGTESGTGMSTPGNARKTSPGAKPAAVREYTDIQEAVRGKDGDAANARSAPKGKIQVVRDGKIVILDQDTETVVAK